MNRQTMLDMKMVKLPIKIFVIIDMLVVIICIILFPHNTRAWISLELLLPFGSVWPGMYLMGELWQRSSLTELLISCNQRLPSIMIRKYLLWQLVCTLLQAAVAAAICLPMDFTNGIYLLPLLVAECFAFGGIGYFLMILFRLSDWSIMGLLCILVGDYGSQGRLFGKLHFSLYWYENLSLEIIFNRMMVAGSIAVGTFLLSRFLRIFSRTSKVK